jgi:hypothetical protein
MDQNEEMTADAVADGALSPGATEGTSSSDVADQEPQSLADAIAKSFAEEYGDTEPGTEETEPAEEAPAEAEAEAPPDPAQQPETDDTEDDQFRLDDAEFRALSPKAKQRIGHLNARAKKAERELSQINESLPQLQQSHESLSKVQAFVRDNNIQPENVNKMFDMAAMLARGDYDGFLATIKPFYDYASQAAGQTIAADLQEQVENGYLTEAHARELTRARTQSQAYKAQAEQERQRVHQFTQQQQQQVAGDQIVQAVQAREAQLRSQDPDFAQKEPMLRSMLTVALESGAAPRTAQDAIALIDRAYAKIPATPAPKPVATPPRPSASSPPRGNAQPKTAQEAIEIALSRMS